MFSGRSLCSCSGKWVIGVRARVLFAKRPAPVSPVGFFGRWVTVKSVNELRGQWATTLPFVFSFLFPSACTGRLGLPSLSSHSSYQLVFRWPRSRKAQRLSSSAPSLSMDDAFGCITFGSKLGNNRRHTRSHNNFSCVDRSESWAHRRHLLNLSLLVHLSL